MQPGGLWPPYLNVLSPRIDADWMDKQQPILVPLANTPAGRRVLRLPEETLGRRITYVSPTGVIYERPDLGLGVHQALFYSGKPFFATRAHRLLAHVARHRSAWGERLAWQDALLRFGNRCLEMHELAAAITSPATFNPQANPATTACDGATWRQIVEAWATIREGAGTGGDPALSPMNCIRVTAAATANQWSLIQRSAYYFDTSALSSAASVLTATFSIIGNVKIANGDAVSIVSPTLASNTTIGAGDYALANWNTTPLASSLAISSWNTAGPNNFVLNASGLTVVSVTAITKLGTMSEADRSNTPLTWVSGQDNYAQGYASETGASKPQLVVTFALPTVSQGSRTLLGIGS